MKERPILFRGRLVRRIIDDENPKTQTRRIIKPLPEAHVEISHAEIHCPYGQPGDRLWVRETWQAIRCQDDGEIEEVWPIPKQRGPFAVVYAATDPQAKEHRDDRGFSWRPGIHMPRWASRIDLDVVAVRAERLQAISEEDARAEGVERIDGWWIGAGDHKWESARRAFESLWCSINGIESWRMNPWVWVVSFQRVEVTP